MLLLALVLVASPLAAAPPASEAPSASTALLSSHPERDGTPFSLIAGIRRELIVVGPTLVFRDEGEIPVSTAEIMNRLPDAIERVLKRLPGPGLARGATIPLEVPATAVLYLYAPHQRIDRRRFPDTYQSAARLCIPTGLIVAWASHDSLERAEAILAYARANLVTAATSPAANAPAVDVCGSYWLTDL